MDPKQNKNDIRILTWCLLPPPTGTVLDARARGGQALRPPPPLRHHNPPHTPHRQLLRLLQRRHSTGLRVYFVVGVRLIAKPFLAKMSFLARYSTGLMFLFCGVYTETLFILII